MEKVAGSQKDMKEIMETNKPLSSETPKEERGEDWVYDGVTIFACGGSKGFKKLGVAASESSSKTIVAAHKAALAELKKQDEIHWKTRRSLLKELAAEREKQEQAELRFDKLDAITENEIKSLRQQLLAALAAIAAHNAHNDNEDCAFIDVDLSALREHDAEVRKPLVDALVTVRTMLKRKPLPSLQQRLSAEACIDAALASVKD
jgi:hypothetical protein